MKIERVQLRKWYLEFQKSLKLYHENYTCLLFSAFIMRTVLGSIFPRFFLLFHSIFLVLGRLGGALGRLGSALGRLESVLGRHGNVLNASWAVLRASSVVLGRLGDVWARFYFRKMLRPAPPKNCPTPPKNCPTAAGSYSSLETLHFLLRRLSRHRSAGKPASGILYFENMLYYVCF